MKKFISIALAALVVIAGVSSCKNDKKKAPRSYTGEYSYVNSIPTDAALVLKLNAGMLLEQSDILNNDEIRNLAYSENANGSDFAMNVLQHPDQFGLNADKPMFLAYSGGEKGVLVASVNSEKLSSIVSLASLSGAFALETEGEINYIPFDSDVLGAYSKTAAVILFGDFSSQKGLDPKKYVTSLLNSKSACAEPGFDRFIDNDAPVSIWAGYESMFECMRTFKKYLSGSERDQFDTAMEMMDKYDLTGSYMLSTLSFNDKGVSLDFYQVASDEMMALSKDHIAKMDPQMLEYLPKEACFAFTVNVKDLQGLLEKSFAMVKSEDVNIEQLKETLEEAGLTLADIPESVAVAVAPLYTLERMPDFTVVFKASQKLYDVVSEAASQLGDQFVMNYNNGYVTLTTKPLYLFSDKGCFSENMTDTVYADLLKSSLGAAMVVDMNNIVWRNVLSDAGLDRAERELAQDFLKLLKDATMSAELNGNEGHTNITLGVKTHGENALKVIVNAAIDAALEGIDTPEMSYEEFVF